MYDTIIIGAGAAGLTSALYTARRNLKTLVLSKDLGGQTSIATEIENYPGVLDKPNGFELMQNFKKQAEKFGAVIKLEGVTALQKKDPNFLVKTDSNSYFTKTLILAFGLAHRELGVPGEKEFKGKGVAYCATCDAPLFKGRVVAVVGGGNSALDAADLLSGIAQKVYLIHRGAQFTAEVVLQKRTRAAKNIELILNSKVAEIKGKDRVKSVVVEKIHNEKESVRPLLKSESESQRPKRQELKLDGIFIEIGYQAQTDWLKDLIKLNKNGEIITDENCRTSMPGILAAGDVTDASYKQIIISAGEGAKAALQAHKYIQQKSPDTNDEVPDWGRQAK